MCFYVFVCVQACMCWWKRKLGLTTEWISAKQLQMSRDVLGVTAPTEPFWVASVWPDSFESPPEYTLISPLCAPLTHVRNSSWPPSYRHSPRGQTPWLLEVNSAHGLYEKEGGQCLSACGWHTADFTHRSLRRGLDAMKRTVTPHNKSKTRLQWRAARTKQQQTTSQTLSQIQSLSNCIVRHRCVC